MKVNFILPSIGSSGGIDVVYKYAELLTKDGYDVKIYKEIICANMHRYSNSIVNFLHRVYSSLKAIMTSLNKNKEFDEFVLTINNKSVRDADVTIATAWPTAYEVNELNASKGKKYYFIQDFEIWDNKEIALETYNLPLNKIVVSTWINNELKESLDIGPFPVLCNGVDTNIFKPYDKKEKSDTINFLMLNHTLPKKGVENGLKCFEQVRDKYQNVKLRMFGMCDNSNLPDYVEYYQNPSKDKLVDLYNESDIFIFPSLEEGWGLTPVEAMACGCAVVGTNTGFVLDIGKHEENMMISEPGDIEGMVSNIIELLDNKVLYKKIVNNAIKETNNLKWEELLKKIELLLIDYEKSDA